MRKLKIILQVLCMALTVWSCSSTRHVPAGEYLLDNVTIKADSTGSREIDCTEFVNYLRQMPNHKVLGFAKLQLATYNLSGHDSTRWYNKWVRRLGQPPVVYDRDLTAMSQRQLRQALINKGYLQASVDVEEVLDSAKRKAKVQYTLHPGQPHVLRSIGYEIADSALAAIVLEDSLNFTLRPGDNLDHNALDAERIRLTELMRQRGYYAFAKEYINFVADTADNSLDVDLTMIVREPRRAPTSLEQTATAMTHRKYEINRVTFVLGVQPGPDWQRYLGADADTVAYKGVEVIYTGGDHYLLPSALEDKCFLRCGDLYNSRDVDMTYESLAQLGIVKSVNIEMQPVGEVDGIEHIDAYIFINRNRKQGVTLELEGTNSEGDFGFGIGLQYQHRDIARRSNILTTKLRVNYESLSGNLSDLINDRYTEYAAEVGLTFPKFLMPLVGRDFKRKSRASTEVALSFNYQERPEYTRVIAGGAWKYKWASRDNRERRTWDLIDINYVYLPESTIDFLNQIAPSNPLLRYSYEDHFIMRMGFTYSKTNKQIASGSLKRYTLQPSVYTLRTAVETAGNILYALSSIDGQKRDDGVYKLFGIQYSQYAKAEVDYSYTRNFTDRHGLAFHVGAGIGVPYGNSRVLPFEKRFYAGGANGVRGWSVRTLGPGAFDGRNSVTDFINQCGDIRLDLSMEYRAKLFWVFEGAAFVDAGNIWTIHNYENQPGGMFHFNTFWKQIAMAYGVGLRMDFSYFLLRFDLGIKAYNPATNQEHWPLIHPRWKRDTAFHFAVGYPF